MKFFAKGTLLDQISQDLKDTAASGEEMIQILKEKLEGLKTMMEHIQKLEVEVNKFKELDTLQTDIDSVKKQMAWALVEEKERYYEGKKKELVKLKNNSEKIEKEIEDLKVGSFIFECKPRIN